MIHFQFHSQTLTISWRRCFQHSWRDHVILKRFDQNLHPGKLVTLTTVPIKLYLFLSLALQKREKIKAKAKKKRQWSLLFTNILRAQNFSLQVFEAWQFLKGKSKCRMQNKRFACLEMHFFRGLFRELLFRIKPRKICWNFVVEILLSFTKEDSLPDVPKNIFQPFSKESLVKISVSGCSWHAT